MNTELESAVAKATEEIEASRQQITNLECEAQMQEARAKDLAAHIERLTVELDSVKPWTPKLLKQYVADTSDGFTCLESCDSHFHAELCPVTNVVQAFRLLRRGLAECEGMLKRAAEGISRGNYDPETRLGRVEVDIDAYFERRKA